MGIQQALIEQIREKQLILTVTAGRTGTAFLHHLFRLYPDVDSTHEEEPNYLHVMRRVQTQPAEATKFLTKFKFPVIAACRSRTVVETSHLFCKGFLEPMINLGVYPDLVLLRRNPRRIALSLLERNTIPGRTSTGTDYLVCPSDPNTLPLPLWEGLTDYQLCFWYALDIECRQQRYGHYMIQLGRKVYDCTASELHNPARFLEMAEIFSLDIPDRDELLRQHREISSTDYNKTPEVREQTFDLDEAEQEVWEVVSNYEPLLHQRVTGRYKDEVSDMV
ncbi:MAG: hypothetical protein QNL87_01430 [Gammaproteobacteria bacterium]|nr:hypothetical protein [Gammaproteobacteria bacterium]